MRCDFQLQISNRNCFTLQAFVCNLKPIPSVAFNLLTFTRANGLPIPCFNIFASDIRVPSPEIQLLR